MGAVFPPPAKFFFKCFEVNSNCPCIAMTTFFVTLFEGNQLTFFSILMFLINYLLLYMLHFLTTLKTLKREIGKKSHL
jgi:hypothetical protein